MIDRRWRLHIDEPTRRTVCEILSNVRSELSASDAIEWTRGTREGELLLDLPRGVQVQDSTRLARLRIIFNGLHLTVEGADKHDIPLMIEDDVFEYDATADPTSEALRTLAFWNDGLTNQVENAADGALERYRADVRRLGLGLIAHASLEWRRLLLSPSIRGLHEVLVCLDDPVYDLRFSFREKEDERDHPMGEALSARMSALAGTDVHVVEMFARDPDELPILSIGSPPEVRVQSEPDDPIEMARIIRSHPKEVTLSQEPLPPLVGDPER